MFGCHEGFGVGVVCYAAWQPPLLLLGLPSSWCGMPCLTRLLFVLEGNSAVSSNLVFLDEGLDGDVWDDCFKGAKSEEMVVFVSFAAMLMPPRGFLDVGPAPCVAGPAGYGYAPAYSVGWRTLSFQFFFVHAATMAAEGLSDDTFVGMFAIVMCVYETEEDCFKGLKFQGILLSVCFVATLMPPRGFLDVGPAPCVAGPAGFGHALAVLVKWYALSFQLFIVFAATMTLVESEYLVLETAPWMAGTLRALPDNDFKELEPQFAALDGVLSVKAAAALAGKCVWTCFRISKESKRALMFQNEMEEEREKGKDVKKEKERVEMKQERKEKEENQKETVNVLVQKLDGRHLNVRVTQGIQVSVLCDELCARFGISQNVFYLTRQGRVLHAYEELWLEQDERLCMRVRLRGGMEGDWTCQHCGRQCCWVTKVRCHRCGKSKHDPPNQQSMDGNPNVPGWIRKSGQATDRERVGTGYKGCRGWAWDKCAAFGTETSSASSATRPTVTESKTEDSGHSQGLLLLRKRRNHMRFCWQL